MVEPRCSVSSFLHRNNDVYAHLGKHEGLLNASDVI